MENFKKALFEIFKSFFITFLMNAKSRVYCKTYWQVLVENAWLISQEPINQPKQYHKHVIN